MNTPDITLEDGAGITGAVGVIGFAAQSGNESVQLAAVVGASVIGALIVLAGAYRRGKRAEFVKLPDVEDMM